MHTFNVVATGHIAVLPHSVRGRVLHQQHVIMIRTAFAQLSPLEPLWHIINELISNIGMENRQSWTFPFSI
jgi:hypothetical protein